MAGKAEQVPGGKLVRFAMTTDPGIAVPMMLLTPDNAEGKLPAVVMVATVVGTVVGNRRRAKLG